MVYNYKKLKIKKKCIYCRTDFITSNKNKKYCSNVCYNKKVKEKTNYLDKKEKICQKCGRKFMTCISHQIYCSIKCRLTSRTFYVDNFNLREYIFERDNFTCQKCGIQGNESKNLDAHHIKPLYKGGKHKVENITTLCTKCHKEEHKIWSVI